MRRALRAALDPKQMTEPTTTHLQVRVAGRTEPEQITVPDALTPHDELVRFLNRQGPYAQIWVRLDCGEYVRYDLIESVALA